MSQNDTPPESNEPTDEVSVVDERRRKGYVLAVNGHSMTLPDGVVRVAVERLIDCCAEGDLGEVCVNEKTVLERAQAGIHFLYGLLRCCAEDRDVDPLVEAEVEKLGGGAKGAKEAYANLVACVEWAQLFFGDLSARFLCPAHAATVSVAQAKLAEQAFDEMFPGDAAGMATARDGGGCGSEVSEAPEHIRRFGSALGGQKQQTDGGH